MRVGLGTGTTVAQLIPALAERHLTITCVATSPATEEAARAHGLEVAPFHYLDRLDLTIDGADQVDPVGWLVKGGGGAQTRERIVAAAAERFVVIVSSDKVGPAAPSPGSPRAPHLRPWLHLAHARVRSLAGRAAHPGRRGSGGLWRCDRRSGPSGRPTERGARPRLAWPVSAGHGQHRTGCPGRDGGVLPAGLKCLGRRPILVQDGAVNVTGKAVGERKMSPLM